MSISTACCSILFPPSSTPASCHTDEALSFHLRALIKFPHESNVVFWHDKSNFRSCGTCKVSRSITNQLARSMIMLIPICCSHNRWPLPSPVYPSPKLTLREHSLTLLITGLLQLPSPLHPKLTHPFDTTQGSWRRSNRLTSRV